MVQARRVIREAFPQFVPVFGAHSDYGGHRAPRDHTIAFRLQDERGKFRSNVVWLMPDWLATLTDFRDYIPKTRKKTSCAAKAKIKGAVVAVKTSKVIGRRCLRFESLDAVLADAEQLAAVESKQLGNWTLGQILMHWALRRGIPAGIRPPAFMFKEVAPPDQLTKEEGLKAFRRAVNRLKTESHRDWEQCFGVFTREEWDRFHMRYAELHLSYIVPVIE